MMMPPVRVLLLVQLLAVFINAKVHHRVLREVTSENSREFIPESVSPNEVDFDDYTTSSYAENSSPDVTTESILDSPSTASTPLGGPSSPRPVDGPPHHPNRGPPPRRDRFPHPGNGESPPSTMDGHPPFPWGVRTYPPSHMGGFGGPGMCNCPCGVGGSPDFGRFQRHYGEFHHIEVSGDTEISGNWQWAWVPRRNGNHGPPHTGGDRRHPWRHSAEEGEDGVKSHPEMPHKGGDNQPHPSEDDE